MTFLSLYILILFIFYILSSFLIVYTFFSYSIIFKRILVVFVLDISNFFFYPISFIPLKAGKGMKDIKRTIKRKLMSVFPRYFFLIIICTFIIAFYSVFFSDHDVERFLSTKISLNRTPLFWAWNNTFRHSLQYIPLSSLRTWNERNYLIVFGIPSVDIEARRRRRNLQRLTCWTFPGVATRSNNFTGDMLVLYILARHPLHNYTYSNELIKEANEWNDIITLPMKEGKSSTNKTIASDGKWGIEAEIGLSKKVYFWFETALSLFPNIPYISKGDDDMFLRVPQFLVDLNSFRRKDIYWGYIYSWKIWEGNVMFKYRYAFGSCYTLSNNIVRQVVTYEPLQSLMQIPFRKEYTKQYISLYMHVEDVMIGATLMKSGYSPRVIYIAEMFLSFHDIHGGLTPIPVSSNSIMMHHVWESEYKMLMDRFKNDTNVSPRYKKYIRFNRIELISS